MSDQEWRTQVLNRMVALLSGMGRLGISLKLVFRGGITTPGNSMISPAMVQIFTPLQIEVPVHGEIPGRAHWTYLSALPLVAVRKCHLDR